jgi:uncharacterized protein (TIGR03067 family)
MKIVVACGMLAFLILSSSLKNSDNQAATAKEYAQFEGVWRFALVEVEGAKQPEMPFETNKIIFISAERRYIVIQGTKITRGVFHLDPSKTPKQIDCTVTDSQDKSRTYFGIYELEGDTYKFCGSFRPSSERPAKLLSEPKNGTIFEVFKRANQSVKDALIELDRK